MPDWKTEIRRRLAPLKLAPTREAEITEEVAQHLEDRYRQLLSAGRTEDAAYRTSLDELQGEDLLAHGLKRVEKNFYSEPIALGKDTGNFFSGMLQDIRYTFRMLRKSPAFTAVAILTLALGIGANTAIFSVVDAILLKPLPYPDANRLAIVLSSLGNEHRAPASGYEFEQIREHSRLFEDIGGVWITNASIAGTTDPQPEAIKLADVTTDFLSLLCKRPALGRLFMPQDLATNSSISVVISYSLWQRKFGADPRVIGTPLHIGNNVLRFSASSRQIFG